MTALRCDDCTHICTEEDLKVHLADVPNLAERLSPGELVPYGECPECGALIHELTAIEGLTAYITIVDGKFEVTCPWPNGGGEPDVVSADPEVARAFLRNKRCGSLMCSSSVDFPEEYGMSEEKVTQLVGER